MRDHGAIDGAGEIFGNAADDNAVGAGGGGGFDVAGGEGRGFEIGGLSVGEGEVLVVIVGVCGVAVKLKEGIGWVCMERWGRMQGREGLGSCDVRG